MRDDVSWSLSLGRWGGVQVRLHALCCLVALGTLYIVSRSTAPVLYGILGLAILFVSIVLHEVGHAVVAWRLGCSVETVVLGPLGGLTTVGVGLEPERDLLIALAGPITNMILCLITVPALLLRSVDLLEIVKSPLHAEGLIDGAAPLALVALKLTCWINWQLVLVNLLPAYPFDMGRVLRAVLWPTFDFRSASLFVSRIGQLTALLLCVAGWLIDDVRPDVLVPAWFSMGLLAMFVFFHSRVEIERVEEHEPEEDMFGYDFSQGYTSLDRPADGPGMGLGGIRRWLERRRAEKERARRETEAEEERRVDEILGRLHDSGMKAISADERALLQRVSARYRNRQH